MRLARSTAVLIAPLALLLAACSEPTEPAARIPGLEVVAVPSASVVGATQGLSIEVTVTNRSSLTREVSAGGCGAVLLRWSPASPILGTMPNRLCTLVAFTRPLPPGASFVERVPVGVLGGPGTTYTFEAEVVASVGSRGLVRGTRRGLVRSAPVAVRVAPAG